MGKVPIKKKKKNKPKYPPLAYRVGDEVFINAFLKTIKGKFFVCKCNIEQTPQPNQRRVYKVKIVSVADHAVGDKRSTPTQASLLGRVITKRENEMTQTIPDFMMPKAWIDLQP